VNLLKFKCVICIQRGIRLCEKSVESLNGIADHKVLIYYNKQQCKSEYVQTKYS